MNKLNPEKFPLSPMEIYRKTLSRQKEIIKTNFYAQELEKKYNKFRYKSQESTKRAMKIKKNQNFWPIQSSVFTQVLRSKLSNVLKTSTPKARSKPTTRISSRINKSFNSTHRSKIFRQEEINFARLSRY
jgi:superoxide dismutase